MHRPLRSLVAVAAVASVLSCRSEPSDAPAAPIATAIRTDAERLTIPQKQSARSVVSVVDAGGTLLTGVPVTFETSDPRLLAVPALGVVTSIGPSRAGST